MISFASTSIFLVVSYLLVQQISSESLNELSWKFGEGDWIIKSTLSREFIDEKYSLTEYIHSSSNEVRGKIEIKSASGKDSIDVFYSSAFNKQRLVVQDNQCKLYTYTNSWLTYLFGLSTTRSLQNHVLLTGPSLLMRLNSEQLAWAQGPDTEIRGAKVRSINTTLAKELNIVGYIKNSQASLGLLQAIRLKLTGYDPGTQLTSHTENIHFDIYSFVSTSDLSKVVTVSPGIGCPMYLVKNAIDRTSGLPRLMKKDFHYLLRESIDGQTKSATVQEAYVSSQLHTAYLKSTGQGVTKEAIYDYNLGIIYSSLKDGTCSISAMDENSFGISDQGYLVIKNIFKMEDYYFTYVGQYYHDRTPGLAVDVWELIKTNYTLGGVKYDKVVISHYFAPQPSADLFDGHVLMATTIKAYNKLSGSYQVIQTITRDYYEIESIQTVDEFEIKLKVSDCFRNSNERRLMALHFQCTNGDDCQSKAQNEYLEVREKILYLLDQAYISFSRVVNLDITFNQDEIIAYLEIMKVPDIRLGLKSEYLNIDSTSFAAIPTVAADSEDDCLKKQTNSYASYDAIVYCEDGKRTCGHIISRDRIKKDSKSGKSCHVFYVFYSKLLRYHREVPLEKLEERLNQAWLSFSLDSAPVSYLMKEAVALSDTEYQKGVPFEPIDEGKVLPENNLNVLMVSNIASFSDCYRACAHADDNLCETFSFCQYSDRLKCFTSSAVYSNLSSETIQDSSCSIYKKNRLLDYMKVRSRKYISPASVAINVRVDECASLCRASDECFSFQQCGDSCTFGGFYTDSSTKLNDECNIYVPKASDNYKVTGKDLVSEVFHLEVNLDINQCAALCSEWSDGVNTCASFNFCPKSIATSTCSLSALSTKDAATKKFHSDTCQNYQLIAEDKLRVHQISYDSRFTEYGTTGKGAFGIIMLFMSIGLVVGLIAPIAFMRISDLWSSRRRIIHTDTFGWSRYENEAE